MATRQRSRIEQLFVNLNTRLRDRSDAFLARRPHRSFRRTYRRDYARSFALPGYLGLAAETVGTLRRQWRLFGAFFILYAIASVILLGVINQTNYSALMLSLKTQAPDVWLRTLTIFGTAITGGLTPTDSGNGSSGALIAGLLIVTGWLTIVWLLRHVMNGTKVSLREGLYNAGAPVIPTLVIMFVGLVQAVPIILIAIGYGAAQSTGLFTSGVESMVFVAVAALLAVLSLYWLTGTFIALIVATLPGIYPFAALRAAGDLVVGRRLRILLRLLFFAVVLLLLWAVILIPVIMLDGALAITWLPLVPVTVLLLGTATLVLSATYIYLLYRKLVDDEAKPA